MRLARTLLAAAAVAAALATPAAHASVIDHCPWEPYLAFIRCPLPADVEIGH